MKFQYCLFIFGLLYTKGLAEEYKDPIKYTVTSEAWLQVGVRDSRFDHNETTKDLGRIVIGLFGDICPMTTTNFAQLCKGFDRGNVKHYIK